MSPHAVKVRRLRRGLARFGAARFGGQGTVRPGAERHGRARRSWFGRAWFGRAWRSTSTKEAIMAFKSKDRQRIIDGYLAESGRNMFVPAEFIDWLADQPEHEAYDLFYGMSDANAARQHRIALARRMASGLRIVAKQEESRSNVVAVTTREYPAYVSPVAGRRVGGGS